MSTSQPIQIVLLTHRCRDCGHEFRGQPGEIHPTSTPGRWCSGHVVEINPTGRAL